MINKLGDKELYDQLQKAGLADRLENDESYQLLKEAAKRITDRAVDEFSLKADPTNLAQIIKLQMVIRLYKHGLFKEIEILKNESELLFQEAKDRGIVG